MAFFSDQSLQIIIKAKDEASKVIKDVEKNLKKHEKAIKKMKPAFRKMAIAGTAAFGAVAVGAGKAIGKARDFEEETNKFNVVFQDVSKEAEKMADTLNKSYGLSRLESKKLLSATGDILTGFGFTGDAALDLSSSVNTLAVDLASFTNAQGGAEAVSSALTKALLGERESLKTYGIAIQEADVQAELLARGMDGLTGEALRQAKAQVTLAIAIRQSKNAVGDYARSTGSLTQTQKELTKTIEDTQIALGETLAPILNDILQKVTPVIEKIMAWVKENPKLARNIIIATGAIAALVAIVGALGLILPGVIVGFTLMAGPVGAIVAIFISLIPTIMLLAKVWDEMINGISDGMLGFAKLVTDVWEGIKNATNDIWGEIKNTIVSVIDFISSKIQSAIDAYNRMKAIVSRPVKVAGGFVSGIGAKIGGALGFEHGGTVPGPRGQAVPIIAHGQEQVIPANQSHNSGSSFNLVINNPQFRNEDDEQRMRNMLDTYFRPLLVNHKLSA